uniref:superoxide dismutase n=1 Tax=Lygus hesperus TaxID=30085 RepID=A0A0A9X2D4_LYGHE
MCANGGGEPPKGTIAEAIEKDFGSYKNFCQQFHQTAATHFGSGWAWLTLDPSTHKLQVMGTHDADTPIAHGQVPLVTLDVWEHAYYLDYQNRRIDFIDAFLNQLLNWKFVEENYNNYMKIGK